MKSFNIKELFRFAGSVVSKVLVEKVGVRVAMLRDGRCRPRCPDCRVPLKEIRAGKIAVHDLPLADRSTVWVTLPAVQGRCQQCRMLITPRPPEVHPTRDATWRLMRAVAAWASFCPVSSVATMFAISEATVRRYEVDVLNADLPDPDLDNLEILLVDEKSVRKGHGYVTVVLNGLTGELLHMAEGKKKESLESFFSLLTDKQKASIHQANLTGSRIFEPWCFIWDEGWGCMGSLWRNGRIAREFSSYDFGNRKVTWKRRPHSGPWSGASA